MWWRGTPRCLLCSDMGVESARHLAMAQIYLNCMQPAGLSCIDNVVKECEEEASIPAALARTARAAGAVSYAGAPRLGPSLARVLVCQSLMRVSTVVQG